MTNEATEILPKDPMTKLQGDMKTLMDEVYYIIVATGRAAQFAAAMKKRAELVSRFYAQTPQENRDVAMGQIQICYELADGALAALAAKSSYATEDEVDRIRKEVADMK